MENELRQIDLSSCEEIGRGKCAAIYRFGEDHAVKMFFETFSREGILKEYEQTVEAQRQNINSVGCFGLVSWQGRTGIELEFIKGGDLQEEILKDPESVTGYGEKMAEELRLIHSRRPDQKVFPPIHEFYLECTQKCAGDGWITKEEAGLITTFIEKIPLTDTMIHGDYHVLNIMAADGRIRLIDMADCMTGNPVYDLLITALYLHYLPLRLPDLSRMLFKLSPEQLLSCWDAFVRIYFETEDAGRIGQIGRILDGYSMLKFILAPYSFSNMKKKYYAQNVETGRLGLMPVIRQYTGIIPENILELGK